jgi:hypothetical protein
LLQERWPGMFGQLPLDRQLWTRETTSDDARSVVAPNASDFSKPSTEVWSSAKPVSGAFYTSTELEANTSMWQIYLRDNGGNALPRPHWLAWFVRPIEDVRVCEIRNASEWASLVEEFHRVEAGGLVPSWPAIATRFDAVHITPGAIAAIQGISLLTGSGTVGPSYWDVESTVWLSWKLTTIHEPATLGPLP